MEQYIQTRKEDLLGRNILWRASSELDYLELVRIHGMDVLEADIYQRSNAFVRQIRRNAALEQKEQQYSMQHPSRISGCWRIEDGRDTTYLCASVAMSKLQFEASAKIWMMASPPWYLRTYTSFRRWQDSPCVPWKWKNARRRSLRSEVRPKLSTLHAKRPAWLTLHFTPSHASTSCM